MWVFISISAKKSLLIIKGFLSAVSLTGEGTGIYIDKDTGLYLKTEEREQKHITCETLEK